VEIHRIEAVPVTDGDALGIDPRAARALSQGQEAPTLSVP